MPPPCPSSGAAKRRPGDRDSSFLSAVASAPTTKKIARTESLPNIKALQSTRPGSGARHRSRPAPSLTLTEKSAAALPRQQADGANKKPDQSGFMAPGNAKTVHPTRRLAPGTAVGVRTRFTMITGKCCLVIWLPARVVSPSDAYHCTVKYSADLSPAYAGKVVRKPVDHIRVVAPQRAAVKAVPRNLLAPQQPERKDCFL